MNLKDRLIRKLLDIGKKHRILVYPTLALVAIVSAISHAFYWGKGNGKKLVASALVMALLITQSIFLTSSADVLQDEESEIATATDATYYSVDIDDAMELQQAGGPVNVKVYRVDESGNKTLVQTLPVSISGESDDVYSITVPSNANLAAWCFGDSAEASNFDFTDLYAGLDFTDTIPADGIIDGDWDETLDDGYCIYFKATRTKYPVVIYDGFGNVLQNDTATVTSATTGDINPAVNYRVKAANEYSDDKGYKFGYKYNGVAYSDSQYAVGATIGLTPSESEMSISMTAQWTGMEFDFSYNAIGSGAPTSIHTIGGANSTKTVSNVVYGEEITLPADSDMSDWAGNEAYYLSGWKVGDQTFAAGTTITTDKFAENGGDITADPNISGVTAEAVWTYKDIRIKAVNSGDGTVSIDDSGLTIEAYYGDTINCVISAEYKKDNSEGTQFSYEITTDDINRLGTYGLSVQTTSDGSRIISYTITGKLKDVTSGTSIVLSVTDANKPIDSQTSQHSVTVVSNKRPVSIDATTVKNPSDTGAPSMTYNGTTTIPVKQNAEVLNKVTFDGVVDDVYVTFDANATLDNANAGTGKTITLSNVQLVGAQAEKYTLVEDANVIPDIAEVMRMALSVNISLENGQSDTILFGQDTPRYTLRIADTSKLTAADYTRYSQCTSDQQYMNFMTTVVGFKEWDIQRKIYSPIGTYTVKPVFDETDSNYLVSSTGLSSSFTVTRDQGIKDVNYSFSTERSENGYYPGLQITATGNYDKIRLVEDGDVSVDSTRSEFESKFANSIVLPDMTNETISFQMFDSGTGAVTEIVTLTGISVDTTAPTIVGFSVTPGAAYFNEFSFGSYYHKQNIDGQEVESATVTVEYSTQDSACKLLYYYFADENGNPKGDLIREVVMTPNSDGNYQASFNIGTGTSGQLVVYASDTTGNKSVSSKLKLNEYVEFIKDNQNSSNYYEWMVENSIESTVILAKDKDGNDATSSEWYNSITFSADVTDLDSGVNKIIWKITNPEGITANIQEDAAYTLAVSGETYGKITRYNFSKTIDDVDNPVGEYTATAVIYDNAGNSLELDGVGPFKLDCKPPVITDTTPASTSGYLSGAVFKFKVSEGEEESGVASVRLYLKGHEDEEPLRSWGALDEYSYNITSNGDYVVVAKDYAGNIKKYEKTFSGISDVNPDNPVITVDGTEGENGWYITSTPYIKITSSLTTSDGVPVDTYYRVTDSNGNIVEKAVNSADYEFQLNKQGAIKIEAWSVSKSNCMSDVVSEDVKVDTDAPDVYITESEIDENGDIHIRFNASDTVSKVDTDNVYINDTKLDVEEVDGIVEGRFEAEPGVNYEISVRDNAGNVADSISFKPLDMVVSPVINITTDGAYIDAKIYEGTNEISDCYIAYKKHGDTSYEKVLYNKHDEPYGIDMDYTFRNLSSDTVYDYKVYAITKVSKEVKCVEGSFKTASRDADVTVRGKVRYGSDLPDSLKTYPIYVSLYEANTFVAGTEISDPGDEAYYFNNVADGSYRIVATNGMLTETAAVQIENGGIVYPTDYLAKNGINFTLDGMSTEVIIEDNAINITADGLDKIYNTQLYNGNVTEQDLDVVNQGGTISITLYASYIDVEDISSATSSIFQNKIGKDAVIEKYIQLYIVKEVRDNSGMLVNSTPQNITRLAEPITITFPLGELSGQKVYVASVHNNGSNYEFKDWGVEETSVSNSFVTIQTDRFSIYALYRKLSAPEQYSVKWIDGDGKVLKTETVLEGESATPPTQTPSKKDSDKYYYVFSGWDTDYKVITGDTVISACFVAYEKNSDNSPDDKPDSKPADVTDAPNTDINKVPNAYTYMGSADSPRTGDEAPLVMMVIVMIISAAGFTFVKKKIK